jgi:midasin (ATPase involved in ribosome maturation)
VLLEGPAATGKTSLVEHIARCLGRTLIRVNNTRGTSVQDYLGSYMPNGEFLPGALTKAMMTPNCWFLADEFDLAEPAVMNLLYPLLEGQRSLIVPNTNQVILCGPTFRFFATQNGSSYAGRKQAPLTLRSRFLDVLFSPFEESELACVIAGRGKKTSFIGAAPASINATDARLLAQLYGALERTPPAAALNITMRGTEFLLFVLVPFVTDSHGYVTPLYRNC